MPRSISKFVMGAVAIGVAVVGASAIGIAAAQSSHEQAKTTTHRIMATVLKTEFLRWRWRSADGCDRSSKASATSSS